MTLGENLQRLRKEKELSQEDVARALFVSRQTISKWETDKAEPGVDNLKVLADLYEVTLDQLASGMISVGLAAMLGIWVKYLTSQSVRQLFYEK